MNQLLMDIDDFTTTSPNHHDASKCLSGVPRTNNSHRGTGPSLPPALHRYCSTLDGGHILHRSSGSSGTHKGRRVLLCVAGVGEGFGAACENAERARKSASTTPMRRFTSSPPKRAWNLCGAQMRTEIYRESSWKDTKLNFRANFSPRNKGSLRDRSLFTTARRTTDGPLQ